MYIGNKKDVYFREKLKKKKCKMLGLGKISGHIIKKTGNAVFTTLPAPTLDYCELSMFIYPYIAP